MGALTTSFSVLASINLPRMMYIILPTLPESQTCFTHHHPLANGQAEVKPYMTPTLRSLPCQHQQQAVTAADPHFHPHHLYHLITFVVNNCPFPLVTIFSHHTTRSLTVPMSQLEEHTQLTWLATTFYSSP
jgi:hypothetical protein